MKCVVIKKFIDLQDNNHTYHEGDTFPREGMTASADRIHELSTTKNRRNIQLIQVQRDAEEATPEAKEEPRNTSAGSNEDTTPKRKEKQKKRKEK